MMMIFFFYPSQVDKLDLSSNLNPVLSHNSTLYLPSVPQDVVPVSELYRLTFYNPVLGQILSHPPYPFSFREYGTGDQSNASANALHDGMWFLW